MTPAALETLADQDLLTALVGLEPLSLLPNQTSLTDLQLASPSEPAKLVVVLVHLFGTVAFEHVTQSQSQFQTHSVSQNRCNLMPINASSALIC